MIVTGRHWNNAELRDRALYADRSRGAEQAGQYLRNYTQSARLVPYNREEKYLVTLYTDDIEHAGTTSDVVLRFKYTDLDGVEQETPSFNAREYANEYYGYGHMYVNPV